VALSQGAHDAIAQVIGFVDGSIMPESPESPEKSNKSYAFGYLEYSHC
jgi:hypothetical protein